jgi:hypothetical protein
VVAEWNELCCFTGPMCSQGMALICLGAFTTILGLPATSHTSSHAACAEIRTAITQVHSCRLMVPPLMALCGGLSYPSTTIHQPPTRWECSDRSLPLVSSAICVFLCIVSHHPLLAFPVQLLCDLLVDAVSHVQGSGQTLADVTSAEKARESA